MNETAQNLERERARRAVDAQRVAGLDKRVDGLARQVGNLERNAETAPDASTTVTGIVELATTAETITGTDATRAVTPAGLAGALTTDLVTWIPNIINLTVGNGTLSGQYSISSGIATALAQLKFGSTTTVPEYEWYLSFPPAAPASSAIQVRGVVGVIGLWDNSNNVAAITPAVKYSSNGIQVQAVNVGTNAPWQWTVNDVISFSLSYPVEV